MRCPVALKTAMVASLLVLLGCVFGAAAATPPPPAHLAYEQVALHASVKTAHHATLRAELDHTTHHRVEDGADVDDDSPDAACIEEFDPSSHHTHAELIIAWRDAHLAHAAWLTFEARGPPRV